jgi:predicted nucleic acid-binding protein
MMSLIVDASVATKWLVEEDQRIEARALADVGRELIAPDIIVAEVGNALWKRCRRKELRVMDAVRAVEKLPGAFDRLMSSVHLVGDAMRLSATLDHPIYDCFYLALAEREAAPLVTADQRLLSLRGRVPHLDIRPLAA